MDTRHTLNLAEGVSITALQTVAGSLSSDLVVLYAPGAGSNLDDRFGAFLATFLEAHGIESWRFQFPYSEQGRKAPDRPAVLEATWRAVIEAVSQQPGRNPVASPAAASAGRLVISGRSMGGRIASMVAAKGAPVAGLALFAYPLIPPGRAGSDRTDHFPSILQPALLCSGTRDAFATPEQLREAAARLPNATLHLLEGAGHGFSVLKSSDRTREDVWQEACEAFLTFLEELAPTAE